MSAQGTGVIAIRVSLNRMAICMDAIMTWVAIDGRQCINNMDGN